MTKGEIKEREQRLLDMTTTFCAQNLDEHYFVLAEKLIKKMGRKREVPFARGRLDIWASAVIHAIGSINFLFDKSFEPYVSSEDVNAHFETKKSSVSAKAQAIKKMFGLAYYDKEFSTPMMQENNPFSEMVMFNGFIAPITMLPEGVQQHVREIEAHGLEVALFTESYMIEEQTLPSTFFTLPQAL